MLDKIYATKSDKDLKSLKTIYTALLIISVCALLLLNGISYYLTASFKFKPSIIFIIVAFWSALNVDFLKKKV